MKNTRGFPICGHDTTPKDPRTDKCRRIVKTEGQPCWQHRSDS